MQNENSNVHVCVCPKVFPHKSQNRPSRRIFRWGRTIRRPRPRAFPQKSAQGIPLVMFVRQAARDVSTGVNQFWMAAATPSRHVVCITRLKAVLLLLRRRNKTTILFSIYFYDYIFFIWWFSAKAAKKKACCDLFLMMILCYLLWARKKKKIGSCASMKMKIVAAGAPLERRDGGFKKLYIFLNAHLIHRLGRGGWRKSSHCKQIINNSFRFDSLLIVATVIAPPLKQLPPKDDDDSWVLSRCTLHVWILFSKILFIYFWNFMHILGFYLIFCGCVFEDARLEMYGDKKKGCHSFFPIRWI